MIPVGGPAIDLEVANLRLTSAQRPWADALSDEERRALDDYKGLAGRAVNMFLRGDPARTEFAAQARTLKQALARAECPADLLVYRGVSEVELGIYRSLAPGNISQTLSFFSTSLARSVAEAVAADENGAVVEVWLRAGQKNVAYVHPFPRYRFPQYEVLVNASSLLRLVKAEAEAIRLELVDDDDA